MILQKASDFFLQIIWKLEDISAYHYVIAFWSFQLFSKLETIIKK